MLQTPVAPELPVAALPTRTAMDLIRAVVREELSEMNTTRAPALLDREGLAQALQCSAGMIDKMRKQGLPTVWLGESPRFVLADVLTWLPRSA